MNKVSLVASSADAETAAENSVIQLDNISLLSRWVLKESDNSTSFSRALLEQAKTTLQLLVCPELGGICTPRFVDVMALHIESSLGFNVLSMCMRAAAALERPDLIDWIMEKGHTKTLEALVTAVAADKLNPLHLSLLKFPCCFERLLAAYPDESRRLQAIEKTFDGFNLLMMAVTECPEQVTALLRYIPDSQRQLLFLDLLVDGRWNHNLLEQAINVHPKNTELVRILLDACPDDETRTSLITRTPPDDRGPVIMAARRNSETLKLLFEQCPISEHPRLLKIKTSYGDNVLITASCSSPNAISTILDASPDNATTSELLTEQGYLGLNAILCAIENAPQYVSVLLQAAPNEHTLTTMLTTQDQDKDNAINLSFGYCPENIDMLMNACTNKTVLSQVLTTQNNKGQNALHRAILCRKPEFVSRVLAASPDDITTHTLLTAQDDAGNNALILAIWYGYPELVSVLLSACPDSTTIAKHVETVADGSANALMSAAQYAPEVMGALIQSGQKNCQQTLLLTQNHKGNNALIMAEAMAETYNYSPAIIETLLHASHTTETKTQILTARNKKDENALKKAANCASPQFIEQLLNELDALPDKSLSHQAAQLLDKNGRHAMMAAAQHNPEVLPLLLKTCQSDHTNIRRMLAAREKNHDGWSVLEHAVGFHNTRHIFELLDVAHELGVLEEESESVQRRALEYCNASALGYMKSRKYTLQPARKMFSQMSKKKRQEREDCRHILFRDEDAPQRENASTGLFSRDASTVAQALIAGDNPNQRNTEDDTPLHLAIVRHHSPELVQLLLEYNADLKMMTQGYTPLQAACLFSQKCIIPLLMASFDKGFIYGERTFTMNHSLTVPRIHDENSDGKLRCTLCRDTYDANDMPVMLPCFHQMYCLKCLIDAAKHQYNGWYRYNSFQPFKCYLCQSLTRYVVDYATGKIEYIGKLRRKSKSGKSGIQFYSDETSWVMHL